MENEEGEESVWKRDEVGDLVTIFKCHNHAQLHGNSAGEGCGDSQGRGKYLCVLNRDKSFRHSEG